MTTAAKSWRMTVKDPPGTVHLLCLTFSPQLIRELTVILYGLIALYTCVFGSLLAIFVPQLCDGPGLALGSNGTIIHTIVRNECSLEQNTYIDIDPLNAVALGFNYLTCLLLVLGFAFELYRERFLCEHFDVDYTQPDNNLELDLVKFDALRSELQRWNKRYHDIFVVILLVATCNIAISGVLVFSAHWYHGYKGATTFVTNCLFLATRLSNTVFLSQTSVTTVKAVSVNLAEPLQFNVVYGLRDASGHRHNQPGVAPSRRNFATTNDSSLTRRPDQIPSSRRLDILGMAPNYPSRYGHGTGV
jgi:hypothetical protein